jgi:hypothetical protein
MLEEVLGAEGVSAMTVIAPVSVLELGLMLESVVAGIAAGLVVESTLVLMLVWVIQTAGLVWELMLELMLAVVTINSSLHIIDLLELN